MTKNLLRQELINTALRMNDLNLNQGSSGNISVRASDGYLITPSAIDYALMQSDDVVLITQSGTQVGQRKPSSEWRIHQKIYQQRKDVAAVLHAHSPWCTTLACLQRSIPAFHYMVAVAGGKDIPCAAYATFGSQALSDELVKQLQARDACLMAHHGMVCVADSLAAVLKLAAEVENLARLYAQALMIGEPEILSDAEMDRVLAAFTDYQSSAG